MKPQGLEVPIGLDTGKLLAKIFLFWVESPVRPEICRFPLFFTLDAPEIGKGNFFPFLSPLDGWGVILSGFPVISSF